ncbi:MAG TPA: lytic transglycosylase domain-containing protein [Acidobacteriota bacterium]|nr:lytic transglycosylase domain-containing protein [Acidobacteriota bacterium]
MSLFVQNIVLLLLAGLVLGLLPSTMTERKGVRLITDIGAAVVMTLAVALLIVGWRVLIPASLEPQSQGPTANKNLDERPNYETVVLPLRPLLPLLKPVIYRSTEEICETLTRAAHKNDLPVHFLIRLLYQESSFRAEAISSAGALGIAQFMPETASDRRLDNPFDPVQAVPASARLLRDLYRKFGNLGLAAAAYNAGPKRIEDWQTNKTPLPLETVGYVKAVTGFPVETWTAALSGSPALKIPQGAPCQNTVGLLASDGPDEIPLPLADPRSKLSNGAKPAQTIAMRKKPPDADRRRAMSAEIAASESLGRPKK